MMILPELGPTLLDALHVERFGLGVPRRNFIQQSKIFDTDQGVVMVLSEHGPSLLEALHKRWLGLGVSLHIIVHRSKIFDTDQGVGMILLI